MIGLAPKMAPIRPWRLAQGSARHRLGQAVDNALVTQVAQDLVSTAEPIIRNIVTEERVRIAQAVKGGLPFAGLSSIAFIATSEFIPKESKQAKLMGYTASGFLLAVAAWWVFDALSQAPPATQTQAPSGGFLTSLTAPVAHQMAQAIVTEADPRIRAIVDDEKAILGGALGSALPYAGGSLVAFLGTRFFMPDKPVLKGAGYSASAGLLIYSVYTLMNQSQNPVGAKT